MTVVNPKSISGINSITTGSGSDNLLTIHTSDASNTERFRIDSTGTTKIVTGIVTTLTATTGIVTTLTTNTLTANSTTKVGSGVTLSPDGDVFATGITTISRTGGNGLLKVERVGGAGLHVQAQSALGVFGTTSNHNLRFISNSNERMLLSTNGNIGIGSDAPTHNLDIHGSGNPYLKLLRSGYNPFYIGNAAGEGVIEATGSTFFKTGGAERLRITSSGNVNIGGDYTQTSRTLAVTGTALFKDTEADIWLESTGPNAVWRILGSTGGSTHRFRIYDNTNGKEPFYIEGSSGTNTQHVHVNSGNLVFDSSGTGIDFSATGDGAGTDSSELLDDYEEGTWTASVTGGSITTNSAHYTKIGNLVTWYLYAVVTNTANDAGQFRIYGLPYTVKNASYYGNAGVFTYTQSANQAGLESMGVLTHNASTYIYFHFVGRGDSNPPVNSYWHSNMLNANFIISGSYFT